MKSNKQIKIIRDGFERNDEKNAKYYFSVYAVFEEKQKEIVIAEKETGVEAFDKAIDYALENDALQIIIVQFSKKNEPRLKRNEHRFNMREPEAKRHLTEKAVIELINKRIGSANENLGNIKGDPSELGAIRQEYQHQSQILKMETKQKFREMEFEQQLNALQREIDSKDEELIQASQEMTRLKSEMEELEKEFEQYRNDKFAGLSEQLSDAGQNLLSGLAAKAIPLLTAGKGIEGIAGFGDDESQDKTTVVEESANPQIERLVSDIREILMSYNETQLEHFYQLMVYIVNDPSNLETIYQLINPAGNGS